MVEEKKESASLAKPAEFFIGLVDFFAILLPGGLATTILLELADINHTFGAREWLSIFRNLPADQHWPVWLAFAVASYLLGHFIFLIGSVSLDNLYDLTFKRVNKDRDETDSLQRKSEALLESALSIHAIKVYSTYQWARVYTRLRSPATALETDRFEADSKFFRSLTVLLFLTGFLLPAVLSRKIGWILFAVLTILLLFVGAVLLGDGWRKRRKQKTDEQRMKEEAEIRLKAYKRYEKRQARLNSTVTAQDDWLNAKASVDFATRTGCAWAILAGAVFLQFIFYFSFETWNWFAAQFTSVVCLALSGWRYMERRYKGVVFTYRLLLAAGSEADMQPGSGSASKPDHD